jgi:hypothetical protein
MENVLDYVPKALQKTVKPELNHGRFFTPW